MRQKWKRGLAGLLAAAALLGLPAGCKRQKEKTQTPADSDAVAAHDTEQVRQELQRLGGEAAYQNAFSELKEQSTTTFEGETYYRYSQYYHGIPVYGRSVVYVADENGERLTVTGNAEDVNYQGALMPQLTQQQAQEAVSQYVLGQYGEESLQELVVPEMTGQELCIYPQASSGDILAHQLTVFYNGEPYEAIVADDGGTVMSFESKLQRDGITINSMGEDVDGKEVTVKAYQMEAGGAYYLCDRERGFYVSDIGNESLRLIVSYTDADNAQRYYTYDKQDEVWRREDGTEYNQEKVNDMHWACTTEEHPNTIIPLCRTDTLPWNEPDAVTAMYRVEKAYDFYEDLFSRVDQNGRYDRVLIVTRDQFAASMGAFQYSPFDGVTILSFGDRSNLTYDGIGHEYAHGVESATVGLSREGEAGAVSEGFADIFGELLEDYADGEMDGSCDWLRGKSRNLIEPEKSQEAGVPHPTQYQDENWENSADSDRTSHINSTVISHAAYLMWYGIDGTEAKRISTETLAKIWYRAMLMMPSDCNFMECRTLVEQAATSAKLTDKQLRCVSEAFDMVKIPSSRVEYTISTDAKLCVYDADGKLYDNYTYQVYGCETPFLLDGTFKEHISERTQTVTSAEPQPLNLPEGYYIIRILDNTDAQQPYTVCVAVGKSERTKLEIFTNYYTKEIAPSEVGELSIELLTSHWLKQSIQSSYVFRFSTDGTFKAYYDGTESNSNRLTLSYTGTYDLDGNTLTVAFDKTEYSPAFSYEVTYLRKDQHPEITRWDCADYIPQNQWFFFEKDFKFGVDPIADNAFYLAWAEDDSIYDQCEIRAKRSGSGSSAGYAAVVQEAIGLRDEVGSYASGGGFLYDLNGDGQLELILLHDMLCEMENAVGKVPMMVCSVYTMENGTAVTLLKQKQLYVEAGGPSGSVGVVWKDGKNYFYLTSESGDSSGDPVMMRRGSWYLYELNGTQLAQSVKTEYWLATKWTGSTFQTLSSQSGATINGSKVDYAAYERWVGTLTKIKETVGCVSYYTGQEDAVSLEELLKQVQ